MGITRAQSSPSARRERSHYTVPTISLSRLKKIERLCRRPFRPMAEFALARAAPTAKLTGELQAQTRQNGRVFDDYVFRIGGSEILQVDADLDKFIPLPVFKGWKVHFEIWPHDILLRTNMSGRTCRPWWLSGTPLSWTRQCGDPSFLSSCGCWRTWRTSWTPAVFRWGLMISDSMKMILQLQSLPETSTLLCEKPALSK
jgi:hypothetical protein